MLANFCLRLAAGMIASLFVLPASQLHPRFFRVHYLTSLALLVVAGFFLRDRIDWPLGATLTAAACLSFLGSIIWHIDGHPGQRVLLVLTTLSLFGSLILGSQALRGQSYDSWMLADDLTSSFLLGSSITAMLVGHSYLLAPSMSINPLLRILGLLGVTLMLRVGLSMLGLWWWTSSPSAGNLETETLIWLAARWFLGFVGPLVLGWMAWETARIRSTQSATGILYVVVIVCFLGELTSQLLLEKARYLL